MSQKMVKRAFDEEDTEKEASTLFQNQIREDAESKVKGARKDAGTKTSEAMNKQCEKKTAAALGIAKDSAARSAVSEEVKSNAQEKAKAAYDRAYSEALGDGLTVAHAQKLAKSASDEEYKTAIANAEEATA